MAVYRTVYMNFWKDTKIIDNFTPEDKYFMLYCLTNDYTNLCGCFEISIKQMSIDTGYNTETIERLLERFEKIHQVIFYNKQNKEMLIKNWYKYNWTNSEKLDKPLLKEIKNIKTVDFKAFVTEKYNNRDTVSIPYIYTMDTTDAVAVTVTDTDYINNNINKKENEKVSDSCVDGLQKIIDFYNNNIGMLTPYGLEILKSYLEDMDYDVILLALKRAVEANIKTIQYIKGTLNNWKNQGVRTLIQAQEENERFKNSKKPTEETKEEEIARKVRELEASLENGS